MPGKQVSSRKAALPKKATSLPSSPRKRLMPIKAASLPNQLPSSPIKQVSSKKATSLPNKLHKNPEFIFFGCWNNIDCTSTFTNRDIVLHLLKKLFINKKIILAGDNWYNYKIKNSKLKYYPLYVLESGYKLLFDISKEVDIVLGNHDINMDTEKLNQKHNIIENFCNNLGCLLKVQYKTIYNILNSTVSPNIPLIYTSPLKPISTVNLFSCCPKLINRDGVYFLYINTNVFETNTCLINEYKSLIEKALLECPVNNLLFIIGHHPFAGLKIKKNIYAIQTASNLYKSANTTAIYAILDLFTKYKSIYLCADIHNFQVCKLHSNVCMVIAGCAGAKADDLREDLELKECKLNENFSVSNLYAHTSYGFSKISYDKITSNVNVKYYYVESYNDKTITYSIYSYLFKYNTSWSIEKLKIDNKNHIVLDTDIKTTKYCNDIEKKIENKLIDPNIKVII